MLWHEPFLACPSRVLLYMVLMNALSIAWIMEPSMDHGGGAPSLPFSSPPSQMAELRTGRPPFQTLFIMKFAAAHT